MSKNVTIDVQGHQVKVSINPDGSGVVINGHSGTAEYHEKAVKAALEAVELILEEGGEPWEGTAFGTILRSIQALEERIDRLEKSAKAGTAYSLPWDYGIVPPPKWDTSNADKPGHKGV